MPLVPAAIRKDTSQMKACSEVFFPVGYNSASRSNRFSTFRDDILVSCSRMSLLRQDRDCVGFECCPSFYIPRDRIVLQSVERCSEILSTKRSETLFHIPTNALLYILKY